MLLKNFIKEYNEKFSQNFKSGFWGEIEAICETLKDPTFHPSMRLKAVLSEFSALENEPLKIAVIGQFSSGKSTLLNTLLKSEILPTGVVPVTAKVTYIKYAPHEFLNVIYSDGRSEILGVSELGNFVDQRKDLQKIKSITIYSSNEILKYITFIDTPGLNSRSSADTKETLRILKEAFGVLWISLIDNAARASEKAQIELLPSILRKNSIMLLSQKDRLKDDEISRVLEHSNKTLGKYFSKISAVSSKLEKSGMDGGFTPIKEFLKNIQKSRQNYAKMKLGEILEALKSERENYIKIYENLQNIIENNAEIFTSFEQNLSAYSADFEKFYARIKEMSNNICEIFMNSVKSKTESYFRKKKAFFTGENFEKIDFEAPEFNKDEALSKLIYDDNKLSDNFRRFKNALTKFENSIIFDANSTYLKMQNEMMLFKGRYESFTRDNEMFSIEESSQLNKIAGEVYELFLKNYEIEFFEFCQKTRLFFEKILIKIITNYENAIILTADFISNKIQKSLSDYKSDSLAYSLYYPKFDDFNNALLNNLHYYEFENDFLGNGAFIKRAVKDLKDGILTASENNQKYVNKLKIAQENALFRLNNLKFKQEF